MYLIIIINIITNNYIIIIILTSIVMVINFISTMYFKAKSICFVVIILSLLNFRSYLVCDL